MAMRILSYTSIEQLYAKDSIFLKEYADAIHITATATLRKGLVEHNRATRWIKAPILSFGQMVKYIGNRWFQAETLLKQSITLTQAYEQFSQETNNKKLFAAFDRNQQQLLTTLRALVESGVTPQQLEKSGAALSEEEQMLLGLWKKVMDQQAIRQYNDWFKNFKNPNKTESYVREILVNTVKDAYKEKNRRKGINSLPYVTAPDIYKKLEKELKGDNIKIQDAVSQIKAEEVVADTFTRKKVIVFHGFYFITPVQKRFLKILEESNIEVVHLIYYDSRYPKIFETVRRFLPMDHSEAVSSFNIPMNVNAIALGKAIHGDFKNMPVLRETTYTVFQQLYQLKEYVVKNPAEKLFSPRATAMEKYFNDLTTAATAELKDYPIGQFLIDLHRLSNSSYELTQEKYVHTDEVDAQILLRLFNSGYLSIPLDDGTVVQGKSLVKALMQMRNRFAKCRTFEDWKTELTYFVEQKTLLERHLIPENVTTSEEDKLYLYPHRDISYYNVLTEELEQILKGISILESFYNRLYTGTNLSIKNYIKQMEVILFKHISPNLSTEEHDMAEAIMEQIRALDQQEFEGINRKDIIKGLAFYLSHAHKESETIEKVEDSNQASFPKAIGSLVDVDGFMFEENRQLHLAFMDNKALPLSQGFSLWPLREETIESIVKMPTKNTLGQLQIRKEMTGSITAYLLYMAMQKATNINFSIVKNVENEHHLVAAFYLQLMGVQAKSYTRDEQSFTDEQYDEQAATPVDLQLNNLPSHHIVDQTYTHCQRRFIVSYLSQRRPSFSSDFHLRFLYQGIIQHYEAIYRKSSGVKKLSQLHQNRVRSLVDNMFPQWTKTRKDLYYRDKRDFHSTTVEVKGNQFYTMPRPISLFGLSKVDVISENTYVPKNKKERAGKCVYCPFKLSCRESLEVVKDDE